MVIAALSLAAAMVQGPSPLARAESLLVAGDTVKAIAVLRAVPFDATSPSDPAMAATIALLWLGRDERQQAQADVAVERAEQVKSAIGRQPRWVPSGIAGRALREAVAIETWLFRMMPPDSVVPGGLNGKVRRDSVSYLWGNEGVAFGAGVDTLRAYNDSLHGAHTLVAGAIRNALAQFEFRALADLMRDDIPVVTTLPPNCQYRSLRSIECALRDVAIEASSAGLNAVLLSDRQATIARARARELLTAALGDPWPFGAMALQTLAGMEVLFGSDSSRFALTSRVAEARVDSTMAHRLTAMALALTGHSDLANAVMERHRTSFASLDSLVDRLDDRVDEPVGVLWRTAWPLYLQPFNERLVVHRARVIAAGLLPMLSSPLTRAPSFAPAGPMIRRGLPLRIERYQRFVADEQSAARVRKAAEERSDADRLIIRDRLLQKEIIFISYVSSRTQETILPAVREPNKTLDLNLSLAASDASHGQLVVTGFVPRSYDHLLDLPHQMMRYQRNGQAMADFFGQPPVPRDKTCGYEAGFFLLGNDLRLLRRSRDTLPVGAATLMHYTTPLAPGAYVYSMEALDTACAVAARARYAFEALSPGTGLSVSDVLLVDGAPSFDAARVSGAIPVTGRAGVEVPALESVSLYWEVYGVTATELATGRLEIEVDAVDVQRGRVPVTMLGQVQERAERASPDARVHYVANAPAGRGPIGMTLSVKIPAVPGAVCQIHVTVTDKLTHAKATGTGSLYVRWEPK